MELIPLKITEEHDVLVESITGEVMSDDEKQLLGNLLSSDVKRIDVLLSDDSTEEELKDSLGVCSKAHGRLARANTRLKPIMGRILSLISNKPEVYESLGYKSYDKFVSEYIPQETGMSRAEAYQCRRIVEAFPSVTIKDFQDIGYVKLGLLCRTTKDGEPSRDEWMEKARESTVEEFKDVLATGGIFDRDELNRAKIEINTTKTVYNRFKQFVKDREIQAYCGTENPGDILDLMMAEVENQWRVQGNAMINQ